MKISDVDEIRRKIWDEGINSEIDGEKGVWVRFKTIEKIIEDAPEVSLKPHLHFDYAAIRKEIEKKMTHGHWIWNEDEWNYQCSVCKEKFDYSKTYELFDHGFQMADYCPCCGAKMEGVKEV